MLLEVEQTLNSLKSRENEMKNQAEEVSIIREKVMEQSRELVSALRDQIDQLEKRISQNVDF